VNDASDRARGPGGATDDDRSHSVHLVFRGTSSIVRHLFVDDTAREHEGAVDIT